MGVMNITDFRLRAAEALQRVEAGEIIEITRNNRPIAELRPREGFSDAEWNAASRRMIQLMKQGQNLGGGPLTLSDRYGEAG